MTRRIGNVVIIAREQKQQCDLCGKIAELRPYGPKGEAICFACGQKHPEAVEAGLRRMFGEVSDA